MHSGARLPLCKSHMLQQRFLGLVLWALPLLSSDYKVLTLHQSSSDTIQQEGERLLLVTWPGIYSLGSQVVSTDTVSGGTLLLASKVPAPSAVEILRSYYSLPEGGSSSSPTWPSPAWVRVGHSFFCGVWPGARAFGCLNVFCLATAYLPFLLLWLKRTDFC